MIDNWRLRNTVIECPNEECNYLAYIEEVEQDFSDDDMDFSPGKVFEIHCKCPECGREFIAECESYIDFSADVKEERNDR